MERSTTEEDRTEKKARVDSYDDGNEYHTQTVVCATVSSDGQFAVSGSGDKTVKIWDIASGKCVHTLRGHSTWIYDVAISTDKRLVASASEDKKVKIWDVGTGRCVHTLEDHTESVNSVAFSNDGRFVASGSSDSTVRIWDIASSKCIHVLHGHTESVMSVSFSPDDRIVASGSRDHTINVWDAQTGKPMHVLRGHVSSVTTVTFLSDGSLLSNARKDTYISIWDPESGECKKTMPINAEVTFWDTRYFSDRKYLFMTTDGIVNIYNVEAGVYVGQVDVCRLYFLEQVATAGAVYTQNGKYYAVCIGRRASLKIVNLSDTVPALKLDSVVAAGVASNMPFLTKGLYDPRLLCLIRLFCAEKL